VSRSNEGNAPRNTLPSEYTAGSTDRMTIASLRLRGAVEMVSQYYGVSVLWRLSIYYGVSVLTARERPKNPGLQLQIRFCRPRSRLRAPVGYGAFHAPSWPPALDQRNRVVASSTELAIRLRGLK